MNDTPPRLQEADVSAYAVHDFHHTEIMLRDQARPGQHFVRPLPSKCLIHFEEDDVDLPDGFLALAGSGQALDTEALHCACAVHAVFGVPSASGKLAAPGARQLAVALLSQAPLKARSSQDIRSKQRLLLDTFWEEFMLRHYRGESTAESDLFAEALRITAPLVAAECRQKYIYIT